MSTAKPLPLPSLRLLANFKYSFQSTLLPSNFTPRALSGSYISKVLACAKEFDLPRVVGCFSFPSTFTGLSSWFSITTPKALFLKGKVLA